jgi:hypothetical protein
MNVQWTIVMSAISDSENPKQANADESSNDQRQLQPVSR